MSTCCCTFQRFREEFKIPLFGLEDYNGKIIDVAKSFTPRPLWLVAIFRLAVVIWIGLAIYQNWSPPGYPILFWFAYYTHWSVILATAYFVFAFIWTIQQLSSSSSSSSSTQELTWVGKAAWVLYSCGTSAQLSATVLYWTLVYGGNRIGYIEIMFHGLIATALLVDGYLVSFIPIRLRSLIPVLGINAAYIAWTVIHAVAMVGNPFFNSGLPDNDDDAIYSVINWNKRPGMAAFWSIVSNIIIFPLVYFLVYAISSIGGGCKFDGSARRYVIDDAAGEITDEETPLEPVAVYGTTA